MSSRVLLIEPDPRVCESLCLALTCEGFLTSTANAETVPQRLHESFQLIVLDSASLAEGVPAFCRRISQHPAGRDAHILLLVPPDQESTAIDLLEESIDAFLVRPFGMREMVARVRALLRRPRYGAADRTGPAGEPLMGHGPRRVGEIDIDPARRRARLGGCNLHLTELEFQLLYFLASHPGRVFDRPALIDALWGAETHVTLRSVDALVKRLRRHLDRQRDGPAYVQTVRGVGYRFVDATPESLRVFASDQSVR